MTWPAVLALLLAAADADFRKGMALLDQNRVEEAIPHLETAAREAGSNALYWKALGVAHARLGDYRGAAEPFGRACRLNADLLDACYYYGRALYAADRYREALEPLRQALQSDPAKARAEAALGQCQEALADYEAAEKFFRAAMERRNDPTLETARLAYGRFLIRQGRAAEAVPLLSAATGDDPEILHELGLALYQAERLPEAVEVLERAAARQGPASPARLLLERARRRLKAR